MATSGLTVALFRARADAQASAVALAARGFAVARAPATETVGLAAPAPPGPFDFAVATSAKAFEHAGAETLRRLEGLALWTVGAKTAQAARSAGLAPRPPADDVAALLPSLPPGRALYLAGRERKPELERALAGRVVVVETYAAQARPAWDVEEARAVAQAAAALHYSPRSATLAAALAATAGFAPAFARMPHVCLSAEVAAPLAQAGAAHVFWPWRPHEADLLDTLESALAERR